LVAGDGPWVVATRETWIGPFERDEGVRLYVIVEEDGAPKLAGYCYVGTLHDVTPISVTERKAQAARSSMSHDTDSRSCSHRHR
jgi:hypothetical protein